MKKFFCAVLSAVLLCGALPVLAGCGQKQLFATFEMPASLPEGVVDLWFEANGTWWSGEGENTDPSYDLLPSNGGTQDDVHLEIFVAPKYSVKAVKLLIEAEDGSWQEEMTELEEGYLIFEDHQNAQQETVECMRYRTKAMPTFQGKSGKAKASVPVLQLEPAKYNLHTEKIWDDLGNDFPDSDKERVQPVLGQFKYTATYNGVTKRYSSWEEFAAGEIGNDRDFLFEGTYKLKIEFPEGFDLTMNSGGSRIAVLSQVAGEDSAAHDSVVDGWVERPTDFSDAENSDGVHIVCNSGDKHMSAVFTYSPSERTSEWVFKIIRGSRIRFNEYELYHTVMYDYLSLLDMNG